MTIKFPLLCLVQTSTTGPSSPYTVVETSIKPGYRSLTRATADGSINSGDQAYYMCRDSTVVNGGNLFEYGIGTWNNSTKQLSRDTIIQSSNGTIAISWGAGTRDLYVSDTFAGLFLLAANNLSDIPNVPLARGALGLGNAALATLGTGNGNVPQMDSVGYPAADGRQITNVSVSSVAAHVINFSITTTIVDYTVLDSDFIVAVDCTNGSRNISLPTAVGKAGKPYIIKKTDSTGNAVDVNGHGAEPIDNNVGYGLFSQYKYVWIVSNGAYWWIVSNN